MEDILRKLIAYPTVTGDSQASHEALEYIASFLAKRGLHISRYETTGYESLVATTVANNKRPKVLLAAHLDVVAAPEALFALQEIGGRYYGRGVLDMKYAIAAYMQVADTLQSELSGYDFGIMITTDEEAGGNYGAGQLVKEGYRPAVCVLPDGGDDWQIQTYSKGFLFLKITSSGQPAHGSRPWLGRDAIQPLTDALQDIRALFPPAHEDVNTLNIGRLEAGNTVNQVADWAQAQLDIRIARGFNRTELLERIEAVCQLHGVNMSLEINGVAGEFDLADPMIAPFARSITEVTGVAVTGSSTLGSNDCRYFAEHGIPCISLYPPGGGHHGPSEWLDKTAFNQFAEILQRYLEKTSKS